MIQLRINLIDSSLQIIIFLLLLLSLLLIVVIHLLQRNKYNQIGEQMCIIQQVKLFHLQNECWECFGGSESVIIILSIQSYFLYYIKRMVIKTELCAFSQWKIYPGRGIRYVAKDGRPFLYLSKRTRDFGLRKLKAQRLRWTTAWRRLHKKLKQSDQGKNKKKKLFRKQRAIEGVTLDDIKKIKTARPEDKKALAEEAVREIKERKRAIAAKKNTDKKAVNKDKNVQQKAQDKAAQKAQKKAAPAKNKK